MSHPLFDIELAGASRRVSVLASERDDGDMHPERVDATVLRQRQVGVSGRRWVMLDQVHGVDVHTVDAESSLDSTTAGVGDVIVSDSTEVDIAVWAADCAPIVLICSDGRVVVAHGGWRGLADGVIDVAAATAQSDGGEVVAAVLGPVIHPCCYEFGASELDAVAAGVGTSANDVTAVTASGAVALDVPSAVAAGLRRHGIDLDVVGPCTGCSDRWYSHRVRGDLGRHAVVVRVIDAGVEP